MDRVPTSPPPVVRALVASVPKVIDRDRPTQSDDVPIGHKGQSARDDCPKTRRVVTGHTPGHKSVVVHDDGAPRVVTIAGMKDFSITAVWATDAGMTALPGSTDPTPAMTTFVPGWNGTRFLITVLPPDAQGLEPGADPAAIAEEMRAKLPGLAQAMEPDHPGMHTTDTVDYDIIMAGELWLELDDGTEVHLQPGDIVIQNGTRHAWRNKGTQPCVMYSVLVGVPRSAPASEEYFP